MACLFTTDVLYRPNGHINTNNAIIGLRAKETLWRPPVMTNVLRVKGCGIGWRIIST